MQLGLDGKVVVITGASGGIGRAVAEVFAAEGALLVLHGNENVNTLRAWAGEQPWSQNALVVNADVRSPETLAALTDLAISRWGRIDVCVANAGIWPAEDAAVHEAPIDRIRRTIEVNLLGAMWTARAFFTALEACGPRDDGHGASLMFTGSTAGRFGERGHSDYGAAKAGLIGLMHSLKNEIVDLDPWGRVNVVEPGWTVTHMARATLDEPGTIARVVRTMPLRQLARAVDIANTIAWMSSPVVARHINGQVITVAGGMEGRVRWEPEQIDESRVRARLAPDDGRPS